MKKLFKWLAPVVSTVAILFAGEAMATALALPQAVYTFDADCTDCAQANDTQSYPVRGTLTLQNYAPGSGLVTINNFVSFSYSGSNLMSAFSITADNLNLTIPFSADVFSAGEAPRDLYLAGNLSNFLNKSTNETGDFSVFFRSIADGGWELGYTESCGGGEGNNFACNVADYGAIHTYTLNSVPEPGSLLLVGAALVGLGVARRRKV